VYGLIYNLFELSIFAVAVVAALKAPESAFIRSRQLLNKFDRIALNPKLAIIVCGLLAMIGSLSVSLLLGIPEPRYHDEFSNLLAAQTFAIGRITNPPHPMWIHFETFHVIQQPSYASKFPPAQGLILAAGQIIGGHPIVGVWISVSLACAALCWMMQAWMPRRWAFFGTILLLLQVRFYHNFPYAPGAVLGYWSQSYWGGAVAFLGGALVFGALPRILRETKIFDSLMLGVGLAILANSRPFEGFVTSIATTIALPCLMIRNKCFWRRELFTQVFFPISIVLVLTAGAIGWYNHRITGNAFQFPYLLHSKTYMAAPFFFFQNPLPLKTYNHELIRDFHTGWELKPYLSHQTAWGLLLQTGHKLLTLWGFYLGPTLTIPFLAMIPFFWKDRRVRFALATCGLTLGTLLTVNWIFPHHVAPLTALVSLLIGQSMRQMRLWKWMGKRIGCRLVYAVPVALTASLALFFCLKLWFLREDWSQLRMRIIAQINAQAGQHLVFVRYVRSDRNYLRSHFEWVYNEPDIDNAKIVWAREMNRMKDRELLDYYRNRSAWLLIHDDNNPPILVPYSQTIESDILTQPRVP